MAIRFRCDKCSRPLNVKLELAGQQAICPNCAKLLVIPHESSLSQQVFHDARVDWIAANSGVTKAKSAVTTVAQAGRENAANDAGNFRSGDQVVATSDSRPSDPAPVVMPFVTPVVGRLPSNGDSPNVDPLAAVPNALWYVRPPSGGQFGPASAELFRQWIQEERVTADSWIWREGWDDWQPAHRSFADLAGAEESPNINPAMTLSTPTSQARTAYWKARRRRTMWTGIGLFLATMAAGALIFLLVYLVRQQGGV